MSFSNDILKLVPNQSEAVKSLAEQYRKFAKASGEDILGLAETVYIANRELNLRFLEEFYQEVGLDPKGTTARKLKEIGEKLTRFQPYLEKLPNTWTTIYVLPRWTTMSSRGSPTLASCIPSSTLKAIEDVVRVKKPGEEEHTFNVFIDLNKVGNALKQKEFARKLKSLLAEYHVDLETSTGHKSELEALFKRARSGPTSQRRGGLVMTPILSEVLRPTEFADLIQPSAMVERLERMAEQRMPMNMLFYGQPGVGKTSAARILLNKLDADYCEINGSMETGIEHVRKNIEMFCVSMSMFSAVKVCFIDECEYLSMNAQASLRGLIEKCTHVRFLLTANDIKKMHPALKSRCLPLCFDVGPIEAPEVIARLVPRYQEKLRQLGYEIDARRLHEILCTSFPDLRAVANRLEFEATPLADRTESALGPQEAQEREKAA